MQFLNYLDSAVAIVPITLLKQLDKRGPVLFCRANHLIAEVETCRAPLSSRRDQISFLYCLSCIFPKAAFLYCSGGTTQIFLYLCGVTQANCDQLYF